MKQFDTLNATFKPLKSDDLQPEMIPLIGKKFNWYYAWLMDKDEAFPGVWAMASHDDGVYCWVPEFDLVKEDTP